MRVIIATVASLDGRLTRGDDPNVHAWSSVEDWHHFVELRNQSDALIMDRAAYEQVRPEPEENLLRVIMAAHPELYSDRHIKGQLEFMQPDPKKIIANLRRRHIEQVLIAGDTLVTYDFLAAGQVDELYMTFEPVLFGTGAPVMSGAHDLGVRVQLIDVQKLNEQGTIIAHYTVVR